MQNSVTPSKPVDNRAERDAYTLRAQLRGAQPWRRHRLCGLVKVGPAVGVHVVEHGGTRTAKPYGLLTCANVWTCPTCSRRIRASRMAEFTEVLRNGLERHPAHAWQMLTVTLRHHAGMSLGFSHRTLMSAWRRARQRGTVARIFKDRVEGTARAVEITESSEHGWHPHAHIAMLTTEWTEDERRKLRDAFIDALCAEACTKVRGTLRREFWRKAKRNEVSSRRVRWRETVKHNAVIAWEVASYRQWRSYFTAYVDHTLKWSDRRLRRGDGGSQLEAYLTDIGLEVTTISTKTTRREGSRTPWEIARAASRGDGRAIGRWREYALAMRGARCIELDDRAKDFAHAHSPLTAHDDALDDAELSDDVSFDDAESVGRRSLSIELHEEMFQIVRAQERIDPLATLKWVQIACDLSLPFEAPAIEAAIDRELRRWLSQQKARGRREQDALASSHAQLECSAP